MQCFTAWNDNAPSVATACSSVFWILFNKNSLTFGVLRVWQIWIFYVLCLLVTVDISFQIITASVCFRCESFTHNTLCFTFFSQSFEATTLFWSSRLYLHFLFGIRVLLVKNTKNVYFSLYNRKMQHKFVKNYKTALIFTK
jgi:hypothetical protein